MCPSHVEHSLSRFPSIILHGSNVAYTGRGNKPGPMMICAGLRRVFERALPPRSVTVRAAVWARATRYRPRVARLGLIVVGLGPA